MVTLEPHAGEPDLLGAAGCRARKVVPGGPAQRLTSRSELGVLVVHVDAVSS